MDVNKYIIQYFTFHKIANWKCLVLLATCLRRVTVVWFVSRIRGEPTHSSGTGWGRPREIDQIHSVEFLAPTGTYHLKPFSESALFRQLHFRLTFCKGLWMMLTALALARAPNSSTQSPPAPRYNLSELSEPSGRRQKGKSFCTLFAPSFARPPCCLSGLGSCCRAARIHHRDGCDAS